MRGRPRPIKQRIEIALFAKWCSPWPPQLAAPFILIFSSRSGKWNIRFYNSTPIWLAPERQIAPFRHYSDGSCHSLVVAANGAKPMNITVVARSSDLLHVMLVRCDRCEAPARLVNAQLDMGHHEVTETWTYRCESCEREITRRVDS